MLNSINLFAQSNLTAFGSNPYIGYSSTTRTNAGFSPGSAGTVQSYNFGNVVSNGIKNTQYVAVGSTPFSSQFPNATLASTDGATYTFYSLSNSALSIVGRVDSIGGPVISYSNSEDILRYTFSMGSNYTDQWAASYNNGTQVFRTGTTTVKGDGTGILIIPGATYMNILRISVLQSYKDSSASFIHNYSKEEYSWYIEGAKEPLAKMATYTFTDGSSTISSQEGSFTSSTVGFEENNLGLSLNLFPNPTTENISLLLSDEKFSTTKFKIINQLGQEILNVTKYTETSENLIKFDVTDLNNGLYHLQLIHQNGTIETKKFMVNH